jgi:predicted HicB family RNase H-like nuclease
MAYPRNFSDLELIKHLEQIEAVQFQLKQNNILGSRIALFLLDSLADIITDHFISQSQHEYQLEISDQIMIKITQNFIERVKFIKKELGWVINEQNYQFIVEMRRLRNDTFHEAKLREDEVIICLVKIYYQIIIEILKDATLYPADYEYDLIVHHENLNHWEEQKLLKYIESKGLLNKFLEHGCIMYYELIEKVLSQYELEADKIYYQNINQILSNDLIRRIELLNKMIIYVIDSLRSSKMREEELEKLLNDEPINQRHDKPISEKDIDDFLQYINPYINDKYRMGNISKKQIDGWKVQAKNLLNQQKIHDTLKKWGEIDIKLSILSNIGVLFSAANANEGKVKTKFTGNIQIKTTPEIHHKISIAAEKSGIDIKSWINEVLTNAVEKLIDS